MIKKLLNRLKESSQILFLVMLIAIISGCASPKTTDVKAREDRRITDILTSEDSKSFKVTIKGNRYLSYSSVTQVSPRGLILHFPDTALGNLETIYTPADNEIINSIEAAEIVEDKAITSSVFIALKKKTAYDLTPMGEGLQISFPKSARPPKELPQQKTRIGRKAKPSTIPIDAPVARRLEDVTVARLNENVIVNVKADGVIKNYKAFNLIHPARIVLDMYHLQSPYEDEQTIAVESNLVNQVRHCVHPDKVRLVVDTNKVASCRLTQMETGIQIALSDSKIAIESPKEEVETQLESVTFMAMQNNIKVNIQTDGAIKDYESFTLDNPPRIIFDIFDLRSPYRSEQKIAVESKWVNQIRYCAHPDKVRLVLDTHRGYLKNYSATQAQNGLLILIGSVPGSHGE
jgi:hypothetical protein